MNKTLESLKSKKFDSKNLEKVIGGNNPTTYGPYYPTRYDGRGGQGGDQARETQNPAGYPAGTQGTDYVN